MALWILACHTGSLIPLAHAGPEGGAVAAGQASIDGSVAGLTRVTQSTDKAVVNWQSFSTAAGETVRFQQPTSSSITLNRVTGPTASQLNGALEANGHVWLMNSNGVVFGRGATVNVNGLVATTLSISDQDFMAGRHRLTQDPGKPLGAVINRGTIRTPSGGKVALIAPVVSNEGTIETPGGQTALAAGTKAVVNLDGQGLVSLEVDAGTAGRRAVQLPGDEVGDALASAVNRADLTEAGSVSVNNGVVTLNGAEGLAVNSGTIRADGAGGPAGRVRIDSSHRTVLAPGSLVSASGTGAASNGGEVRALSHGTTAFDTGARLEARGGATGDGGFVEVSGEHVLVRGTMDASAAGGKAGTLLIDPATLTIVNGSPGIDEIDVPSIEAMSMAGDVILQAASQIIFKNTDNIDLRENPNPGTGTLFTLEVLGNGSITIDGTVAGMAGDINQFAGGDQNISVKVNGTGSIDLSSVVINAQAGQVFVETLTVGGAPTDAIMIGGINSTTSGQVNVRTEGTVTLGGAINAPSAIVEVDGNSGGVFGGAGGTLITANTLFMIAGSVRGPTPGSPLQTAVGNLSVLASSGVNVANTGALIADVDNTSGLTKIVVTDGSLTMAPGEVGTHSEQIYLQTLSTTAATYDIVIDGVVDSGISAPMAPRRITHVEASGNISFVGDPMTRFVGGDDGTLIAHNGGIGSVANPLETDFYTLKAVTEVGTGGIVINNRSRLDITQDSQVGVPGYALDVTTAIGSFDTMAGGAPLVIFHDTFGMPAPALRALETMGDPTGRLESGQLVGRLNYANTGFAPVALDNIRVPELDVTVAGALSVTNIGVDVSGINLLLKTTGAGADITLLGDVVHDVDGAFTRISAARDIINGGGILSQFPATTAGSLELVAGGQIGSGGAGRLFIDARSGLSLDARSGMTAGGGVFVDSTNGLLLESILGAAGNVEINVQNGSIARGSSPSVSGISVLLDAGTDVGGLAPFAPIPVFAGSISSHTMTGDIALMLGGATVLADVTAGTGGSVKIAGDSTITVQNVSTIVGSVDIGTTAGAILDGDGVDGDISSPVVMLGAPGGIGQAADSLEVSTGSLVALAGPGIHVENGSAGMLTLDAQATGAGAVVDIGTAGGMLLLRADAPGGSVSLRAGGTLSDGDADVDIVAGTASLTSSVGIGVPGAAVDTDVDVLLLTLSSLSGGSIDISEADGLVLADVTSSAMSGLTVDAGGPIVVGHIDVDPVMLAAQVFGPSSVSLTSGGSIVSSLAGIDIAAQTITLSAAGNIGADPLAGGKVLLTDASSLALSAGGSVFVADVDDLTISGSAGNLFSAAAANLNVAGVSAARVVLAAGGTLSDVAMAAPAVIASEADLFSAGNIGALGADFKTSVDVLRAGAPGEIHIDEASGAFIDSVMGGGLVRIITHGPTGLGFVQSSTAIDLTVIGGLDAFDGPGVNLMAPTVQVDAFRIGQRGSPIDVHTGVVSAFSSAGIDINVVGSALVQAVAFGGDTRVSSTFGSLVVSEVRGDTVTLDTPSGSVVSSGATAAIARTLAVNITSSGDTVIAALGIAGTRDNPLSVSVGGTLALAVKGQDGTGAAGSFSGSVAGGRIVTLISTPFQALLGGVDAKLAAGNIIRAAQLDRDLAVQAYGLYGQLALLAVDTLDRTLARSLLRFQPGTSNPVPVSPAALPREAASVVAHESVNMVRALSADLGPAFADFAEVTDAVVTPVATGASRPAVTMTAVSPAVLAGLSGNLAGGGDRAGTSTGAGALVSFTGSSLTAGGPADLISVLEFPSGSADGGPEDDRTR